MLQLVQGRRQTADTHEDWPGSVNRPKAASSGARGGKADGRGFAWHWAIDKEVLFRKSPQNCRNLKLYHVLDRTMLSSEATLPMPYA